MNIIFMGTPDFAVPSLEILHEAGHNIRLVITQPDRPSGRGKKLKKSAVKEKAENIGIEIFQPEKIKTEESVLKIKSLNPDLIIVVAYGQILSKEILSIPKYGCINVHASLLPELRGAAPINWAIINGMKKTGVTTMLMDMGLDTGDILLKQETEIEENTNCEELHNKLMDMGAKLLRETIDRLEKNELIHVKQDEEKASYASMLSKSMLKIDWNDTAQNIHNKIRGLSPWPCSFFIWEDKNIKIYKSSIVENKKNLPAGYVLSADNDGICIKTSDHAIMIKELQIPGKRRMTAEEYLKGNKFPENITL